MNTADVEAFFDRVASDWNTMTIAIVAEVATIDVFAAAARVP